MPKKTQHSLIDRVESGRFIYAVLATYSVDIPFFEASVMRHLLRNGCRSAAVFVDGHKLADELIRLTEPGHQRQFWFGRHYSLVPVHHTAAFHPKVSLLVGSEIELFIGSGNLEPGGLANNVELYHRITCGRELESVPESRLITEVWQYLSRNIGAKVPNCVRRQLRAIEHAIPWITKAHERSDVDRVVLSPGADVIGHIRAAIDRETVKTLYVMSPFFDHDIRVLDQLIAVVRPERTVLLIQPETVSIPGDILRSRRKIEVYRFDPGGYVHAKLVVAECSRSSVILAGSHNVSERAFKSKNYEASLIRISKGSVRYADVLGLSEQLTDENKIDISAATLQVRKDEPKGGSGRSGLLISAQVEGNVVEVLTTKRLDSTYKLLPVGLNGIQEPLKVIPVVDSDRLIFTVPGSVAFSDWTAVAVRAPNADSNPVPLIHVRELERRAESADERQIGKQIRGLCNDMEVLPDLLSNVSALLMSSGRLPAPPPASQRGQKQAPTPQEVKKLSYEDFVVPWNPEMRHRTAPVRRSNLELAIAAIARALDGRPIPDDILGSGVEEIADENGQLANKSFYSEEALADGKLEKDKGALRQLEYEINENEVHGVPGAMSAPKPTKKPQPSSVNEAKLRSLKKASSRLIRFTRDFPEYIESLAAEEGIDPEIFETLSQGALLVTQFLNRQIVVGHESVTLLDWEVWADFNIEMLGALTSTAIRFLERIRWDDATVHAHEAAEQFLGYLAVAERICRLEEVDSQDAARILVGILRVSRQLGVSKGLVRNKMVNESARAVIPALPTSVSFKQLNWMAWVNLVNAAEKADDELRATYAKAAEIASRQKSQTFWPGEWVWWPHADGHIGIVLSVNNSSLLIACEPRSDRQVAAPYVVRLDTIPPVREIVERARRAFGGM